MTTELGATLSKIAFFIYAASAVCYVAYLIDRRDVLGKTGTSLLAVGLLVHISSLIVRTTAAQRPPFLNLYEYMLSVTCGGVIVYLALELITRKRVFGSFVVPLIAGSALMTIRLPTEINPTLPALRSAWRVPHIATAVFAYSAFAIAFGLAIMYLIADGTQGKKGSFWAERLPSLDVLDRTIYRMIAFGFMMQVLLIITGAIWAQSAWGSYWSWDPKETWALITWLVYAAYLHIRTTKGWKGRKSAIMAIIGFIAVIFTLFGVNYLGGLHSYT